MARELRLITTQECPQACLYCHKEGMEGKEKNLLDASDYEFLFKVTYEQLRISRVTVSGGEPLTRGDIDKILEKLKIQGAKIKLVTNGILLKERIKILRYLDNISISLTTLNPEKFAYVHGSQGLEMIIKGIKAIDNSRSKTNVRLNVCCVKDINDNKEEIQKILDFAEQYGLDILFIELLDPPEELYISIEKIEKILLDIGLELSGKSKRKWVYNYKNNISVELERCLCRNVELTNNVDFYCTSDNDLFITPDGKIKPCMLKKKGMIDILEAIKERDKKSLGLYLKQAIDQFGYGCPKLKNSQKKENK